MSKFQYQARKVTEPKTVVRNLPDGVPQNSGLGTAWDSRDQAWNLLRRIDQRVSEAEKPTAYEIGLGAKTEAAMSVDRVPSYMTEDSFVVEKGVKLDDYARSGQLKSKLASLSRKVSKKDDKYEEERVEVQRVRTRSPLRESSNYEEKSRHRSRREKFELKPVQYTDTKTSDKPGIYWSDTQGSKVSGYYSTMTDSGVVHDVDVRVLNDDVPASTRCRDGGSIFTHVDVAVPKGLPGPQYKSSVNETYTVPSQSRNKNKVKRALKEKSAGLKKIQEKIAQQKMNMSSSTEAGSASDTSMLKDSGREAPHCDEEAVVPRQYELYGPDHPPVITSRKIAAGPKAPTYKGFNEAEAMYKVGDGKVLTQSEHNRYKKQAKRDKMITKLQLEQGLDLQPVKENSNWAAGTQPRREEERAPKKQMTRVIAPRKEPTADKPLEVITTRSWREGQKLLGERGLIKAVKKGTSDQEKKSRTKTAGSAETRDAASKNPQADGTLSELARAVRHDLRYEQSDTEEPEKVVEQNKKKSPIPIRRKRHRPLEAVREEKVVCKKPEYDRHQVREYMRKQQQEKHRKEKEKREEERQKEERRKENLQKLAEKQREAAKRAKSAERKDERIVTSGPPVKAPSSGSDKENASVGMSTDDTLTETEPAAKPRPILKTSREGVKTSQELVNASQEAEVDALIRQYIEQDRQKEQDKRIKEQASQEWVKKYLTGQSRQSAAQTKPDIASIVRNATGMDPNQFVHKYAPRVKQLNPRYQAGCDVTDSLPAKDVIPHVPSDRPFVASQGGAKWDRIQKIKQMSNDLQSRLHEQTQQISGWNSGSRDNAAFVSRYQRLAGDRQDIFSGELPGVGKLESVEHEREVKDAATRIQAAYRGHQVRRSVEHWLKSPEKSVDGEESVDLSASSVSDDSQLDARPPSKALSEHLKRTDFCVKDGKGSGAGGLEIKYLRPSQPLYAWREPQADPYSVINIFERRQREFEERGGAAFQPLSPDEDGEIESEARLSDVSERAASPVQRARSPVSQRSKLAATRSASYQDDFESVAEASKSLVSKVTVREESAAARSLLPSSSRRGGDGGEVESDQNDDTLEDTLTHSDDDVPVKKERASKKTPVVSDISPVSSFSEDITPVERTSASKRLTNKGVADRGLAVPEADVTVPQPGMTFPQPGVTFPQPGQRMSPAMLQQRLGGELGFLESTEESLRQLTEVERARAVSMAQQETVSLAQIVKAQKLGFDEKVARLQLKIKEEEQEAARRFEESQRRAAAESSKPGQARASELDNATRALLERHEEAAQATLEAAKQLAESVKANGLLAAYKPVAAESTPYGRASVQKPTSHLRLQHMAKPSEERATQYSTRSYTQYTQSELSRDRTDVSRSYATETYMSESEYTKTQGRKSPDMSPRSDSEIHTADDMSLQRTESVKSDGVVTADDASRRSTESIRTESGAVDRPASPPSKSESIQEEYAQSFDTSFTEEEHERSLRDVLPSEGHRRRLKKNKSGQDLSMASFSEDFPNLSQRGLSFEEDTFAKFVSDMYEQYIRQPDVRQKHQDLELRQREKAVSEKLQAEMTWYEQQKRKLRDKGTDDNYPQIRKQRGIITRLRREQAEIRKRIQEQQRYNMSPKKSRDRMRKALAAARSTYHDEDKATPSKSEKDYKSDSEIYSESNGQPASPGDNKIMHILQKMKLDEKYLTKREQQLIKRRKNAEDLLAWNQRLDQEEKEIAAMECQALAKWESNEREKKAAGRDDKKAKVSSPSSVSKETVVETTKAPTPRTPRYAERTESVATEIPTESMATERESIRSRTVRSITEEISALKSRRQTRTASESSIPEEEHLKKDSSDDTIINSSVEYSNDTFEATEATSQRTRGPSTSSPRATISGRRDGKPRGESVSKHSRKASESESEDSIVNVSETVSEASDVENRIRVLTEELQRRKREAEELKREHKRNKKDKLREQELSLKKQIKAYDDFIDQKRIELQDAQTKPVIKQPIVKPTAKADDLGRRPEVDSKSPQNGAHTRDAVLLTPLTLTIETTSPQAEQLTTSFGSKISSTQEEITAAPQEESQNGVVTSPPEGGVAVDTTEQDAVRELEITTNAFNGDQRSPSPVIKDRLTQLESLKSDTQSERSKQVVKDSNKRPPLDRSDRTVSITEDIPEDVISAATDVDRSEVKFVLDKSAKEDLQPDLKQEVKVEKVRPTDSVRSITEDLSYNEPPSEPSKQSKEPTKAEKTYSDDYESDRSDSRSYSSYTSRTRSHERSRDSRDSDYSESDYSSRSTLSAKHDRKAAAPPSEKTETKLVTSRKEMTMDIVSERKTVATDIPEDIHTDQDISEELSVEEEQTPQSGSQEDVLKIDLTAPTIEELNKSQELAKEGAEKGENVDSVDALNVPKSQELSQEQVDITKIEPPAMPLSQEVDQGPLSDDLLGKASEKLSQAKEADESLLDDVSQSELVSAIKSAAEAVESFDRVESPTPGEAAPGVEAREQETKQPQPLEEVEEVPRPAVEEDEEKEDKASEVAAQNLLNEALTEVLGIRKRKERESLESADDAQEKDEKSSLEKEKDQEEEFKEVDIPIPGDDVTVRPIDEIPPRPESPDIPSIKRDTLDDLYREFEIGHGAEDFWMEDEHEFSFGKPDEPIGASKEELKLDLNKMSQPEVQEVVYKIPNDRDQVLDIVHTTTDVYWQKRRYGESWEDVETPSTLFKPEDKGSELDSRCRKTYKQLLFDLTGEILCDMYVEEDVTETPPWAKPPPVRHKYYKGKTPPTTSDELKPLAESHVLKYLHMDEKSDSLDTKGKLIGRKKKDHVDEILIQELREEEPDWVNYDADELAVKMQLADAIFDSLLVETGRVIAQATSQAVEALS